MSDVFEMERDEELTTLCHDGYLVQQTGHFMGDPNEGRREFRLTPKMLENPKMLKPLYESGMVFVAFRGMRRSGRMTPDVKHYRPNLGPDRKWFDNPTSPDEEERIGQDLLQRAVPNFISVGGSTAGTTASVASAAGMDNTTMVSTLSTPVAHSKQSNVGNIGSSSMPGYKDQDDDGSSKACADETESWDDVEPGDLEAESFKYTKSHKWAVWG